jgi:hypothetical protein
MATARVSGVSIAAERAEVGVFATEYRLTGLNLLIAFIALAIGGLFGVLQALQYNGIDLYKPIAPVCAAVTIRGWRCTACSMCWCSPRSSLSGG